LEPILMNKRIRAFLTGLAAFLFFTAARVGNAKHPESQDARDVERVEQRWLAAENDPAVLETILADDFVHALPAGLITKQQQIDYLRAHPSSRIQEQRKFERLDVRVYGDTAIANGIVAAATADGGAARRTVFTDVFVKRNGAWQAVNAQENPMEQRGAEN